MSQMFCLLVGRTGARKWDGERDSAPQGEIPRHRLAGPDRLPQVVVPARGGSRCVRRIRGRGVQESSCRRPQPRPPGHPPRPGQPARNRCIERAPAAPSIEGRTPRTDLFARRHAGAATSAHPFRRSLDGISVAADDRIYALGDDEVRISIRPASRLRGWKVAPGAVCLTVGARRPRLCRLARPCGRPRRQRRHCRRVRGRRRGQTGRHHVNAASSAKRSSSPTPQPEYPPVRRARTAARGDRQPEQDARLHAAQRVAGFRCRRQGRRPGDRLGPPPCDGVGARRLAARPVREVRPARARGFVGCCNPVNLAVTPDGKIVTAEKMVAGSRSTSPTARLLAVIGPEHFDPRCTHISCRSIRRAGSSRPIRCGAK